MTNWVGILWVFAMYILHEVGHIIIAKQQGIYKNVSIIPFGLAVNMTTYLKSRWDYLAGIAFSCLAFPLFWVLEPALRAEWYYFLVFAVGIGCLDIVTFLFYNRITRAIDQSVAEGKIIKDMGIPLFKDKVNA